MELNDYQKRAMTTCTESSRNFGYMMMNLVGEVGELAGKVAKGIRKEKLCIGGEVNSLTFDGDDVEYGEYQASIMLEAGDILWQLSGLCSVLGWSLEEVADANLKKLAARKAAGTIVGNGDGISGVDRTK